MNAYYLCDECGPRIFNRPGDNICKTCNRAMYWEDDEPHLRDKYISQRELEFHKDDCDQDQDE
jgi:uncharacterized Zn finger protein (UPF0148 family)